MALHVCILTYLKSVPLFWTTLYSAPFHMTNSCRWSYSKIGPRKSCKSEISWDRERRNSCLSSDGVTSAFSWLYFGTQLYQKLIDKKWR